MTKYEINREDIVYLHSTLHSTVTEGSQPLAIHAFSLQGLTSTAEYWRLFV